MVCCKGLDSLLKDSVTFISLVCCVQNFSFIYLIYFTDSGTVQPVRVYEGSPEGPGDPPVHLRGWHEHFAGIFLENR